jgi:hypothetical protein
MQAAGKTRYSIHAVYEGVLGSKGLVPLFYGSE